MPKNEDGEFELVVGNKQLLSVAFIMMVLFGVVFSMGYFLGRANSGGEVATSAAPEATANGQGRPEAVGPQAPSLPAAQPQSGEGPLEPGEAKVATPETSSAAGSSTAAVTESGAPAPAAKSAPPGEPRQEAQRPEPPKPAAGEAGPEAGQTFLQVAAVKKPQAELLAEVLKKKGLHAIVAPVAPGGAVYRTLVGPIHDASDLAKTRADIENATGIKAIVRKF